MKPKWKKLHNLFKEIEIPEKILLLEENEISKYLFIVKKGCLRSWVNNNGKDITTQFFFEGDGVSSIESFKTRQPSLYSIESLEPCVLQRVSQKDFQQLINESPEFQKEMEQHLFERFIQTQKYLLSHLRDTPRQRYEDLLKNHPEIIKRVPQHYIASYLGITSVSLSRIRNRG